MKYAVPLLIALIILYALKTKTPVYDAFIDGAAEGMKTVAGIFPALAAVLTAAYMLRASGALDLVCRFFAPLTSRLGVPSEVMPLILMRPVSGGGATGLLSELLAEYGADSDIGRIASVVMGSTETTFYCVCVYFAKTRVKHTAKVIPCALIGDAAGIISGIILCRLFF